MAWIAMKQRYFRKVMRAFRTNVLLWSSFEKSPVQIKSVKIMQSGAYVTIKLPTPRGKELNECKVRMGPRGDMYITSNHLRLCHHQAWGLQMNNVLKETQKAKWLAYTCKYPPKSVESCVPASVMASLAHLPTFFPAHSPYALANI